MNTYIFSKLPSEQYKFINLNNHIVYLNKDILCTSAFSILLAHTILGKNIYIYDNNGNRILNISFSIVLNEIEYAISFHSIYFITAISHNSII